MSTTFPCIGGKTNNPTYEQLSAGRTGHTEVVTYGAKVVSYDKLLEVFWKNAAPHGATGSFASMDPNIEPQFSTVTTSDAGSLRRPARRSPKARPPRRTP